ncbi:MAG: Lrp/AsnC ligand binding domain-containing protein [Halobacteriaceae archaeon]
MVHAFVMVKTGAGEAESVRDAAMQLEGVIDAHVVAGNYDVIAEISGGEVYDVLHAVSSDIQDISGVTDTKTYVALD